MALTIELADRFDASIIGLGAATYELATAATDALLLEAVREQTAAIITASESNFRTLTAGRAKVRWISGEGYPERLLADHAGGADLIVTSRPHRGEPATFTPRLSELVMQAGAPVLVVADKAVSLSARQVIVGWKQTREARRAVSDALPFLKRAQKVVVVAVSGEEGCANNRAEGLVEVGDRLKRHGVNVDVEVAPKGRGSVAEALEDAAGRHGADLIVTGAYGRSRLQEWWLGGVTEDFVMSSARHLLLSR